MVWAFLDISCWSSDHLFQISTLILKSSTTYSSYWWSYFVSHSEIIAGCFLWERLSVNRFHLIQTAHIHKSQFAIIIIIINVEVCQCLKYLYKRKCPTAIKGAAMTNAMIAVLPVMMIYVSRHIVYLNNLVVIIIHHNPRCRRSDPGSGKAQGLRGRSQVNNMYWWEINVMKRKRRKEKRSICHVSLDNHSLKQHIYRAGPRQTWTSTNHELYQKGRF